MARTKKNIEQEIDEEAGLGGVAVVEAPKALKANEFTDEYTLEVNSDYDPSADIFRIPKKDPNFEYRYLRDDAERLSITTSTLLHQKGGWQLVPKAHCNKIGFSDRDLSEDGFRRIGKHILAFMPKSLYETKVAAKQEKTNLRTSGIKRLIGDGIQVVGGNNAQRRLRDKSQKDNSYETPND